MARYITTRLVSSLIILWIEGCGTSARGTCEPDPGP
jgi:hypothetical protein